MITCAEAQAEDDSAAHLCFVLVFRIPWHRIDSNRHEVECIVLRNGLQRSRYSLEICDSSSRLIVAHLIIRIAIGKVSET
jgi:hypothetical protein